MTTPTITVVANDECKTPKCELEQVAEHAYAAGREDERKSIVAYLRDIPVNVIDDWGLNATVNIADIVEAGDHITKPEAP